MKIVINKCFGGFGLSKEAIKMLKDLNCPHLEGNLTSHRYANRDCPKLVEVVEKLKDKSFGGLSKLKVVTIPDGLDWEITDYDGQETIEEVHRSWS